MISEYQTGLFTEPIAKEWRRCDYGDEMKKTKEIVLNTAPSEDLLRFVGTRRFGTILCDPPWQFQNRTVELSRFCGRG